MVRQNPLFVCVSRESFLAISVSEKATQWMLRRIMGTTAIDARKPN
jgi:hypothetical protein